MSFELKNVASMGLVAAGLLIGAVIVFAIAAALMPTYTASSRSIVENITDADWGNDTANSLNTIWGLILALAASFGIVGLILAAVVVGKKKGYL